MTGEVQGPSAGRGGPVVGEEPLKAIFSAVDAVLHAWSNTNLNAW